MSDGFWFLFLGVLIIFLAFCFYTGRFVFSLVCVPSLDRIKKRSRVLITTFWRLFLGSPASLTNLPNSPLRRDCLRTYERKKGNVNNRPARALPYEVKGVGPLSVIGKILYNQN